jgi:hypothetical protein
MLEMNTKYLSVTMVILNIVLINIPIVSKPYLLLRTTAVSWLDTVELRRECI